MTGFRQSGILVGRSGVEPLSLVFQTSTPTVYVTYPYGVPEETRTLTL